MTKSKKCAKKITRNDIAQGAHDARIETARAFLALGVATQEQIAQATGLPLAEVLSLANEAAR